MTVAVIVTTLLLALAGWLIIEARWPLVLAVVVLAVAAASVMGHDMPSGFAYDGRCCNAVDGDSGDCAPISDAAVRIVADGFVVTLNPGDHPRVTRPLSEHIRYGQPMFPSADLEGDPSLTAIQLSPDHRWHACVLNGHVRCLYIQPGSV